jgi:hypothetical protein
MMQRDNLKFSSLSYISGDFFFLPFPVCTLSSRMIFVNLRATHFAFW